MKLYVYNESASRAGRVVRNPELVNADDMSFWGEGTEEQLAAQARKELTVRYDMRSGGAGDAYRWRCADEVLDYLGVE